jgi:hypothetical protein
MHYENPSLNPEDEKHFKDFLEWERELDTDYSNHQKDVLHHEQYASDSEAAIKQENAATQEALDLFSSPETSSLFTLEELDLILTHAAMEAHIAGAGANYPLGQAPELYEAAKKAYDRVLSKPDTRGTYLHMQEHQPDPLQSRMEKIIQDKSPRLAELLKVFENTDALSSTDELLALTIRSSIVAAETLEHTTIDNVNPLQLARQLILTQAATARKRILTRTEAERQTLVTRENTSFDDSYYLFRPYEQEQADRDLLNTSLYLSEEMGQFDYAKSKEAIDYWAAQFVVEAAITFKNPSEFTKVKQIIYRRAANAQYHLDVESESSQSSTKPTQHTTDTHTHFNEEHISTDHRSEANKNKDISRIIMLGLVAIMQEIGSEEQVQTAKHIVKRRLLNQYRKAPLKPSHKKT